MTLSFWQNYRAANTSSITNRRYPPVTKLLSFAGVDSQCPSEKLQTQPVGLVSHHFVLDRSDEFNFQGMLAVDT
jgi:hypothetical protein